ncbi:hypothetical protein DL766_009979 [Monosporascus sp. MC13-8B]|uniref:NADP-dependent oxidoreductase domain-containing protein n=1 Tax=Monosporascus cannonballus TaxID=155416 RepID=A0ABY0HDT5_9PEZI|nr:hypothetical protein DL762_003754 [Monosporascus cannonballus]RYO96318.1 hypothetical protein DL763_003291 [Monosporascus cannonballus]RYP12263.1 hypothetical protein DL766_009979 [Monosporascus sp. MC13-8B]
MPTKAVPLHPLCKNGPSVPALGFGLMGLSLQTYGPVPNDEDRFAVLGRAVELGATFWDTSDLYSDSEELLGKWFKRTVKRDQIFLATKFGLIPKGHAFEVNSSLTYCKKSCAESLKRLGVDSIDLCKALRFQIQGGGFNETSLAIRAAHVKNNSLYCCCICFMAAQCLGPSPYPLLESGSLTTLFATNETAYSKEGKVKHIGLSSVTSNTLRRACKIAPVAAVQTEYSVFDQAIEGPTGTDLLATCHSLGVAVVVATPPRARPAQDPLQRGAVSQFRVLADKKGRTVAQLALAWLLKQGDDIFPIPGMKRIKYLEENWASLDISLTDEEDVEIRAFGKATELAGDSLPEKSAGEFFRDTKEESGWVRED